MKKVFMISICILFVYASNSFSGDIYKWVDDKGITHYSDSPTDKSKFEKSGAVKIIPATKYVEPAPQPSDTPMSQISKEDVIQLPEPSEKSVSHKDEEIIPQNEKGINDRALQQTKQITIKKKVIVYENVRAISPQTDKGQIQNKPIRSVYGNEIKKYNEQVKKANETRRLEYEKKQKEVETHNARVKEYNAQVNEHNAQLNNSGNKPDFLPKSPSQTGVFVNPPTQKEKYKGRKPYLGKDDPNMPYLQRHPSAR